jgi:hypothetical protein
LDKNKKWLATIGQAEYKTLVMKNRTPGLLYYIFFFVALILVIYRIYLRNNNRDQEAQTVLWIALGFLLLAGIYRYLPKIFPKKFGHWEEKNEDEKNVQE